MSHDAIFVPRPIFGFAAIFATHLYAPNLPPIKLYLAPNLTLLDCAMRSTHFDKTAF